MCPESSTLIMNGPIGRSQRELVIGDKQIGLNKGLTHIVIDNKQQESHAPPKSKTNR